MLAWAPECGWTLTWSAPGRARARGPGRAPRRRPRTRSRRSSACPGRPSAYLLVSQRALRLHRPPRRRSSRSRSARSCRLAVALGLDRRPELGVDLGEGRPRARGGGGVGHVDPPGGWFGWRRGSARRGGFGWRRGSAGVAVRRGGFGGVRVRLAVTRPATAPGRWRLSSHEWAGGAATQPTRWRGAGGKCSPVPICVARLPGPGIGMSRALDRYRGAFGRGACVPRIGTSVARLSAPSAGCVPRPMRPR